MEDSPHLSPHSGYNLYRIRIDLSENDINTSKVMDICSYLAADYIFICHEISKDVHKGHYQGFFESKKGYNFPSETVNRWIIRKHPELKGKGRRSLSNLPVSVGYAAKDGNLKILHGYTTPQKDEFLRIGKLYTPKEVYKDRILKQTKQEIFSDINEQSTFNKKQICEKVLTYFRENNRIYNMHQLESWCFTLWHRQKSIDCIIQSLYNDTYFKFFNIEEEPDKIISHVIL